MNQYNLIKIILLIYGLNIPGISVPIMMLTLVVLAGKWAMSWQINKSFVVRFLLLFLFSTSYYVIIYHYDFIFPLLAFKYLTIILAMYSLGFAISNQVHIDKPDRTISIVIAAITGFVVYALLCILPYTGYRFSLAQLERAVLDYWTQSCIINGTSIGALGALGLCLLPVIVLSLDELKKLKHGILSIMIILVALGLYINIMMQNRTAFVVLFLAFIACFLLHSKSHSLLSKKNITLVFLVLPFFVLCLSMVLFMFAFRDLAIYQRFMESGLETKRFEAALSMLKSLPENYCGGRSVYLEHNLSYVHNLWLDVAYEAGIIPFLLLIIFHISHFKHYVRFFKSSIHYSLKLMIMALTVTCTGNFFQEPTMNASVLYFSLSCFLFGLVLRLSSDITVTKYQQNEKI